MTSKKTTKKTTTKKSAPKKAESKAVALVEENELIEAPLTSAAMAAHANYDMAMFKDVKLDVVENQELFKNDILIPKVWLVQAMSDLRKQKKADEGQFVDSLSGEVLADLDEELKFVVLKTFKRIQTFKLVQEGSKVKKEFVSSEIMVLGKNHNLPYQETIDGEDIIRRQVISAYVLIERDAVQGINKPYIIDFAASSKYGGRKLVSDIKTLQAKGLPAFVAYFTMKAFEENFEDGSAFVKDTSFGGYLPKEAMPFLIDCWKSIDSLEDQIEIDDSDLVGEARPTGDKAEANVNQAAANESASI